MNQTSGPAREGIGKFALFEDAVTLLTRSNDLRTSLLALAQKIHDFFKPDSTCLLLMDDNSQELRCEAALGSGGEEQELKAMRVRLGEGASGWSAQQGQAVLIRDVRKDHRCGKLDSLRPGEPGSVLCVPIRGSQKNLGVFLLRNSGMRRSWPVDSVSTLALLAGYAAIALEHQRHLQQVHALSITDDCTGLYNARHLTIMLEAEVYRSARFGHEFSLVFMDLDDFKEVNDLHGHLVGSRLLGMVGDLIKSHLRVIDSAFRYGGDEFVLLLPQTSKRNALTVVRRLRDALNGRLFSASEGWELSTSASYGIASFPADGSTAQELLNRADQAMYKVKMAGRDNIAIAGEKPSD